MLCYGGGAVPSARKTAAPLRKPPPACRRPSPYKKHINAADAVLVKKSVSTTGTRWGRLVNNIIVVQTDRER